jgi:hypothetical protein
MNQITQIKPQSAAGTMGYAESLDRNLRDGVRVTTINDPAMKSFPSKTEELARGSIYDENNRKSDVVENCL